MKCLPARTGSPAEEAFKRIVQAGMTCLLAPASVQGVALRPGHHAHDAWELFLPHEAVFRFEVAGRPLLKVRPDVLLLVPPGCVHMGINMIRQSSRLSISVLFLPGSESPNGSLSHGGLLERGYRFLMTPEGYEEWRAILGMSPEEMLVRAAAGLGGDGWGRERGQAQVRLVLGAFAEAAARTREREGGVVGEQRVRRAEQIVRERFYEPDLSLSGVAAEVGLSLTHMATRFKAVTGRTFWKTLVELRLSRARSLLEEGRHSVKEVAALTGWSSQLYFSAAFRRRYGMPPSRVRKGRGLSAE